MHDRERAAEDRRPHEPEVERQVPDLDPRRAVERERGRAREQLALGEEELPACVEIKILRRVQAGSPRRPPRHRRDASSMSYPWE